MGAALSASDCMKNVSLMFMSDKQIDEENAENYRRGQAQVAQLTSQLNALEEKITRGKVSKAARPLITASYNETKQALAKATTNFNALKAREAQRVAGKHLVDTERKIDIASESVKRSGYGVNAGKIAARIEKRTDEFVKTSVDTIGATADVNDVLQSAAEEVSSAERDSEHTTVSDDQISADTSFLGLKKALALKSMREDEAVSNADAEIDDVEAEQRESKLASRTKSMPIAETNSSAKSDSKISHATAASPHASRASKYRDNGGDGDGDGAGAGSDATLMRKPSAISALASKRSKASLKQLLG